MKMALPLKTTGFALLSLSAMEISFASQDPEADKGQFFHLEQII
jgi:hypothetical protein